MKPKLDPMKLVRERAISLLVDHLHTFLRFYRLRLERGTVERAARKWVKSWGDAGAEAFVWLIDEAKGFSTQRALSDGFWRDDGKANSRHFFTRLRKRTLRCVTDAGTTIEPRPIFEGREYYFSTHGVALSLGMRGISPLMRDQVVASTQVLANVVTANLRGVVEQVLEDPMAGEDRKEAAREVLRSWGASPIPKPKQADLFERSGTDG